MKRTIFLFIAMLCLGIDGMCDANAAGKTTREVSVDVLILGNGSPRPRPRSTQAIIEIELDELSNQLTVVFDEELGPLTIDVKNSMGQVVSSYSCNTDMEPMVIMNVPGHEDFYTICILGANVEAYASYEIFGDE